MTRYKQTRHGWMEPDDEHGGWVLLNDALATISKARREERNRIIGWLSDDDLDARLTLRQVIAALRDMPEEARHD